MSSHIEFAKKEIMEYFAEIRADVGYALNDRSFFHSRMKNWNPMQKNAFGPAIESLLDDGLIEDKGNTIVLTEKGVEAIYPDPGCSIRDAILDFFAKNNAQAGHVFNDKAFFYQYMINWNPKEKRAFELAVHDLIEDGIIEERNGSLFLTEKRFEKIY